MAAPAKKAAAKKTTTSKGRWADKPASGVALTKFEEEFEKSMGVHPGGRPKKKEFITTGSMNLDFALITGGVPRGRIMETWGPEHAGKTTIAILQAVQFQRAFPAKRIAWVDMEQTFDYEWAEKLGLDTSKKKMWFYTPQSAEDVADAVKRFVMSGMVSYLVLDSVGGMISRMEMEKEADEATVGKVPGIVTRMVKTVSPMAYSNGTTVNVINQVRAQIGGYGADEGTGGGWALKHITTIKMKVRRAGGQGTEHTVKMPGHDQPMPVGHQIAVKVEKHKMAAKGGQALIWLHNVETSQFGPVGIDATREVFDFAKRFNLIGSGSGGNYEVEGVKVKTGEAVVEYLREHPDVTEVLRGKVLATVAGQVVEDDGPPEEEDDDPMGIAEMVDAR